MMAVDTEDPEYMCATYADAAADWLVKSIERISQHAQELPAVRHVWRVMRGSGGRQSEKMWCAPGSTM